MQHEKTTIKYWAKDDRPREKLLSKNPRSLSNSELIAIILGSGTRSHSATELAKDLLRMCKDNLQELGRLSAPDLMQIKGIGQAKAVAIVAALELGRRSQAEKARELPMAKNSQEVIQYLRATLRDYQQEVVGVCFLNNALRIKSFEIISQGGITAAVADIRVILQKALLENATGIILAHNHPSGSLVPSTQDKQLTTKLYKAASLHDIRLLDHIIISGDGHFSFGDAGLLESTSLLG